MTRSYTGRFRQINVTQVQPEPVIIKKISSLFSWAGWFLVEWFGGWVLCSFVFIGHRNPWIKRGSRIFDRWRFQDWQVLYSKRKLLSEHTESLLKGGVEAGKNRLALFRVIRASSVPDPVYICPLRGNSLPEIFWRKE